MVVQEAQANETQYSKGVSEQVERLQVHERFDRRSDVSEVSLSWHIGLHMTPLTPCHRRPTRKEANSKSSSAATRGDVQMSSGTTRPDFSRTETGRSQRVQKKVGSCVSQL